MSFAFSFSGEDLEDDDDGGHVLSKIHNNDQIKEENLAPPALHSLDQLLSSIPSQISYNTLGIPSPVSPGRHDDATAAPASLPILRRLLFDIRTQLMAESDLEPNSETDILISGLDQGDLTSGIYEGGFKTWECAVDLASHVADLFLTAQLQSSLDLHVIELGAGSAVPSLSVLHQYLRCLTPDKQGNQSTYSHSASSRLKLTLCDYNLPVLRLCTAPNILLNTQNFVPSSTNNSATPITIEEGREEGELTDIDTTNLSDTCQALLTPSNITINFISGSWGPSFLSLLTPMLIPSSPTNPPKILILASETLYSPSTLPLFTRTLLSLLRLNPSHSKALIASKKIYFGVGGGIDEFVRLVRSEGGVVRTVFETAEGVGRVILEVTIA